MAEKRESNIGTLKVDIDCSDALKGLKAVRREAEKTAKAIENLIELQKLSDVTGRTMDKTNMPFTTINGDIPEHIKVCDALYMQLAVQNGLKKSSKF